MMYPRIAGERANTAASASPTVAPGTSVEGQSTCLRKFAVKVTRGTGPIPCRGSGAVDTADRLELDPDENARPPRRKQPAPAAARHPARGASARREGITARRTRPGRDHPPPRRAGRPPPGDRWPLLG